MKTLGAIAAASIFAAGLAETAQAQSSTPQSGSVGSVALAPQRPGHYSGPADPGGFIGGPGWRNDGRWWDRGRWWSGDDRDEGKCRNRRWCKRPQSYGFAYGYGSGQTLRREGPGYFVQSGDAPEVLNGRPDYDYDRGYPYDYYSEAAPTRSGGGSNTHSARTSYCETKLTRDRRTREQVTVRICRN
jgi:hypothetical protein